MNSSGDHTELPCEMITEARGRAGGRVYYMRNGRICARTHVIPGNPRTAPQQRGRARFAAAVRRWRALGDRRRALWNRRAGRMNMSGYNLFISRIMKRNTQLSRSAGRSRRYEYDHAAGVWRENERGKRIIKAIHGSMILMVIRHTAFLRPP